MKLKQLLVKHLVTYVFLVAGCCLNYFTPFSFFIQLASFYFLLSKSVMSYKLCPPKLYIF